MNQNVISLSIENLELERIQILRKLERLQETLQSEVDPDAEDSVLELEVHERAAALIQTLNERLRSIDEALQQAQQGRYGFCERCGQPIDPARLEIMPETTFCIECKRIVERQKGLKARTAW